MHRGMRRIRSHGRHTSPQAILVEALLFLSMFGLAGHLVVNFWERYVIQTEITKLKSSLYSIQDTLTYIGNAYDNLHRELTVLAEITDDKIKPTQRMGITGKNRKSKNDFQVQTALAHTDKKVSAVPLTLERFTQETVPSCNSIDSDFYITSGKRKNHATETRTNKHVCYIRNNTDASASASFLVNSAGVGSADAVVSTQSADYRNSYKNKKIYSVPNYDEDENNNMYITLSGPF